MGRSVLVVDDDAAFRDLAARILRSWGHDVVGEAGTCAEAITRSTALQPDTVLADIGLPDGDGFELTRRLVGAPWNPRIVLISSDADAANGPAARRVGALGFFPKAELSGRPCRSMIDG
jgi:CheY-like chemotaxis protein